MGRIILFTGKGGVGKTSVAAAHAVKSAEEGKKTLLVSADMAHNLGDIFETRVGRAPVPLGENLDGLELDPDMLLLQEFPEAADAFRKLLQGSGAGAADPGDHFLVPSFEDLFSLLKIMQIFRSGDYDRILVDCAPAGETLSLLKLPELLSWYMEKFFPVGKTMVRILAPIADHRYHVELPDRKAMDEIEEMHRELIKLQDLLKDESISSVRLVCTPEKMAVEETKRSYMYLSLYGYRLDGVFINRVLPEQADNAFFRGWRDIQRGCMEELRQVFREVPVTRIPWYPEEVRGKKAIRRICEEVLTDPDLFSVRAGSGSEVYRDIPGGYQLCIALPGALRGQAEVQVHGLDLDIILGNYTRRIPLPGSLHGIRPSEAVLEDGELRISFPAERGGEDHPAGREAETT